MSRRKGGVVRDTTCRLVAVRIFIWGARASLMRLALRAVFFFLVPNGHLLTLAVRCAPRRRVLAATAEIVVHGSCGLLP